MGSHLSGHASPPRASPRVSEQPAPRLGLRVEQVDVFRRSSAQQRQARVQTAVPQTLNPHLGVEVHRSDVLRGKGHVLWSKLFVILLQDGERK